MIYLTFYLLGLSFVASLFFNFIVLKLSHQKKWYDYPDLTVQPLSSESRKVHTTPKPKIGGLAIVSSVGLVFLLINVPEKILFIYLFSVLIFIVGLLDDFKNLSALTRLTIQLIVSLFICIICNLSLNQIYLTPHFFISLNYLIGILLSSFIILGSINSMNMIDGLDGLAGGLCGLAFIFLSTHYYLHTHDFKLVLIFGIPIVGALLGFLKFNFYPSKIFMGDSGSNWIGFMLGIYIILIQKNYMIQQNEILKFMSYSFNFRTQPIHDSSTPVLINLLTCFSIPIFDTFYLIFLRALEKKNPFCADARHIHHSMLKMGMSHKRIVLSLYGISFLLGVLSLFSAQNKFLQNLGIQYVIFVIPLFIVMYFQRQIGKVEILGEG